MTACRLPRLAVLRSGVGPVSSRSCTGLDPFSSDLSLGLKCGVASEGGSKRRLWCSSPVPGAVSLCIRVVGDSVLLSTRVCECGRCWLAVLGSDAGELFAIRCQTQCKFFLLFFSAFSKHCFLFGSIHKLKHTRVVHEFCITHIP